MSYLFANKNTDYFTLTRNCLEYLMSVQRAFVNLREDVSALKDLERFPGIRYISPQQVGVALASSP
jgi:hypothetical protein